jgi:sarcosine oxidase
MHRDVVRSRGASGASLSNGAGTAEVGVVGGGVVGLSTTLALQNAGIDARCFERGQPGEGQSAGETRLFRHRHHDERLISLAIAARLGWLEWEARASTELLGREGVLRFGDDVDSAFLRLRRSGVAVELLSPPEQAAVLPGLVSPAQRALLESTAGVIRARRAIELLVRWLDERLVQAEVLGVQRLPSSLRLHTSGGSWDCERLVLCAGPSTPALARGLGIEIPIVVRCHPRAGFRRRQPEHRLAGLQDSSGTHGELVYGAPCADNDRYVVGLVGPDSDAGCEQAKGFLSSDIASLVQRIQSYVSQSLGCLHPEVASLRLCHTTKLGDQKDAFAVWAADDIVAIAGNNLFKFAPVLGRVLADAAVKNEVPSSVPDGNEIGTVAV